MQRHRQDIIGQFGGNCFVLSSYIQQAGYQQCFVSLGVSTGQMTGNFLLCLHVLNAAELIQQDTVVVSNAVVRGGQEIVMPFYIVKQGGWRGRRAWGFGSTDSIFKI